MGCRPSKSVEISSTSPSSPKDQAIQRRDSTILRNNATTQLLPTSKKRQRTASEIKFAEAAQLKPEDPKEMWAIVSGTCEKQTVKLEPTKNRKGWKTIRIFVSSTFKDFHCEREVLVKEVFPDLRLWCEQRKLRLVECDLRWGVPKDSTTEETIKICLGELDRCYEDNVLPFFLNLAGERTGWIPDFGDLTVNVASQYGWVYGLSVTEMEIVHGAFRTLNPNALFMIRQAKDIDGLPNHLKEDFRDSDEFSFEKLKTLKEVIQNSFPSSNVIEYATNCTVKQDRSVDMEGLTGESDFSQKVFEFFKDRIEMLYPLDPSPEDPLQVQRDAHETFLDSRSQCVLGRDKILTTVDEYICNSESRAPLLIIGTAGAGKSAVMAKMAHDTQVKAEKGQIPLPRGFKKWRVFFHFVGATPGSTDLAFFLQRLMKELKPDLKDIVSDLESLIQLTGSLLSNPNVKPMVVFVDAVNQIDEDKQLYLNRWLPDYLSPNIRVVVSMIEGTQSHQMLRLYKSMPKEVICGPLDLESRSAIVKNILATYNKRLDDDQTNALLHKQGSSNPLWLTLACEELRVHGNFQTVLDKITSLPDDLISLEMTVFSRFEDEAGGELMVATLCLLEVSRHGLVETELLALLGDNNNVKPRPYDPNAEELIVAKAEETAQSALTLDTDVKDEAEKLTENFSKLLDNTYMINNDDDDDDKEKKDKDKRAKLRGNRKQVNYLPARQWAIIYRNLKPLLRPCGDLGEGRLDFYHRSLSKAVRKKYFSGDEGYVRHIYNFWHGVCADFFERVDDMDRKAEELPYHLEHLLDNNRLIRCLLEWPVFDRLYSEDFSIDLLHSWQKAGGYAVASAMYRESIKMLRTSGTLSLVDYGEQMERVITFLIQAGQYNEAFEVLEDRKKLEETELGSRPEEMADVFQLMAKCKSEVVKNHNFVTMDQLEEDLEVVEYCRKSLDYRQNLSGEEHEFKRAMINVLIAHHLSILADLKQENSVRVEAFTFIDDAIQIFEKMNDIGHLAEAIMTKSFINPRHSSHFEEKKKQLLLAQDLCMKAYGEKHLLACRLYLNIGILYEDHRDFQMAYDYFVKWNICCLNVMGPTHPKTKRSEDTLKEVIYLRIKQERDRMAAGTA